MPETQICLEQVTNDSIKTRLCFPLSQRTADHIIGAWIMNSTSLCSNNHVFVTTAKLPLTSRILVHSNSLLGDVGIAAFGAI